MQHLCAQSTVLEANPGAQSMEWPSREWPGAQMKEGRGAGEGNNPWCIPFVKKGHNCRLCTHRNTAAKPLKLPPIPSQGKANNLTGKLRNAQKGTFLSQPKVTEN